MQRFLSSIIICICSVFALAAQDMEGDYIIKNPNNRNFWGIRAGCEYTVPGQLYVEGVGVKQYDPGYGIVLGGFYCQPIIANLYLDAGVSFFYDTYSYKNLYVSGADGTAEMINPEIRKNGFHFPVKIGYHLDFWEDADVRAAVGLQPSVGIGGELSINSSHLPLVDLDTNLYSLQGNHRRFDLGWIVSFGVRVQHWMITLSGTSGLLDIYRGPAMLHEFRFCTALGYIF